MLDINQTRLDFPILNQLIGDGNPLVYLDNAATTQKPSVVIEAIQNSYLNENSLNDSGGHYLSRKTSTTIENARNTVADFIHADSSEITFCRGTTDAINIVANSWGHQIKPGDEVLITAMEHHSNLVPWQMVCKQKKANLSVIPMNQQGELELQRIHELISNRTRILAMVHTSNSLGTINPVGELIEIAHRKGIPVLLDGAQTVAHQSIDVKELDCDFFVFSGHKLYGPTGIGVLFAKNRWIDTLQPLLGGCGSHTKVSFTHSEIASGRSKMDTGIANLSGAVGLSAGIRYVTEHGMDEIGKHLHDLLVYGTEKLETVPGLKIIGTAPEKSGIVSFTMDPIHPHDIGTFLDQEGIAVRTGHHCTLPVMQFFQIPGTVRASFSMYNNAQEIDHLVDSLKRIRKYFDG